MVVFSLMSTALIVILTGLYKFEVLNEDCHTGNFLHSEVV